MKRFLKSKFRWLLGEYEIYNVYYCEAPLCGPDRPIEMVEISGELCQQSPHAEIRKLAGFGGDDAKGFGLIDDGDLVCACWYMYGERYAVQRGFLRLKDDEAKLVQITTAPSARNNAFARSLIAASSLAMLSQGFNRLYARIWRGHTASERAFSAVGWKKMATVLTLPVPFSARRARLQWPSRR